MKNIYIKFKAILVILIFFQGCDMDLDINTDPDLLAPSDIPISAQLPTSMTGLAAASGTYFAIPGGLWSQFFTQSAVANQYRVIDDYSMTNSSALVTDGWSQIYDALTDIRNVQALSLEQENWNYYLISTTLEVYAFQLLADFYEDAPYVEANDPNIINPVFNTSEEIYDLMTAELVSALSKNLADSPVDNVPGDDDFIFSGDMDKWTQFANTLLLKVYLRQSNARPTVAQNGITSLINSGASFLDEAAAITQFVDEDSRSNPLYENERRQLNVGTNLRASSTLGTYLQRNADTRLAEYFDGNNFQEQGDFEDGSADASLPILNATDPFYFMTKAESKFIQAEARVRYMSGSGAQTLYEDGVSAAFERWGLDGSTFIAGNYAYPNGTDEENIEAIILQKWVDLFPGCGHESFIEQNRTGYPSVSSVPTTDLSYTPGQLTYSVEGTTGGDFPRRFEYPSDELQTNTNAPTTIIDITEKTWYAN